MQQFKDAVLNDKGVPVGGALVTVTLPSGAAASLYSGNGTGLLGGNTVAADSGGNYQFYAANGRYTLTITASGYATSTKDVVLFDPFDDDHIWAHDYASLQHALDAVSATHGGTVLLRPGFTDLASEVQVPPWANVWGMGLGATKFRSTNVNGRLRFVRGAADGRGGSSGNFSILGQHVGSALLRVDVAVERTFQAIDVSESFFDGIVIEGAQNCTFVRVTSQNNNNDNWVFNLGAGNNTMSGCGSSKAGNTGVRITQTAASPSGAFAVPTGNRWYGGVIERGGWSNGPVSPNSMFHLIAHAAGRFNGFYGLDFGLEELTTAKTMVFVDKISGLDSEMLTLSEINWGGTAGQTTALEVVAGASAVLDGRHAVENMANFLRLDDTARVYGDFWTTLGNVGSYFVNRSGGTQPMTNLVRNEVRRRSDHLVPLNFPSHIVRADGETFARLEMYPGALKLGTGSAAADLSLLRSAAYGIDSLKIGRDSNPVSFVVELGRVGLIVNNVAPNQAAPNGWLAINTSGGAGSTFYVRENGNWVAK